MLSGVLVTLGSFTLSLWSQQQSPLKIDSPEADSYVSGPTTLRATVEPSVSPTRVVFFADGRQVCQVRTPPFACVWDAGETILSHQIRVVVSLANGERLVQILRTKDSGATFRSQIAAVQVPVTVRDGRRFIGGLPEQAFRIYENDRLEPLVGFIAADVPLELVIAIDVSGSVKNDMPALKAAAAELLSAIPVDKPVTVLAFNDEVFPVVVRQTAAVLRLQALEKLESWGGTALYDAVILGLHTFRQQPGRKVLVVFTDGEDQGSRATLEDAQRRVGETEALVYMVGAGRALDREAFRREMRNLSEPTGGRAIFTENIEKLRDAFRELVQELSAQYLLSYVPSNATQDGTWRRIKVAVSGYSDVRARQGYRASQAR